MNIDRSQQSVTTKNSLKCKYEGQSFETGSFVHRDSIHVPSLPDEAYMDQIHDSVCLGQVLSENIICVYWTQGLS